MPNIPPPDAPPGTPVMVPLVGGTRLSRVHSHSLTAEQFNPTLADPHWGGGRFDATAADPYGYLYAGSDDECAVCESLLRDLAADPSGSRFLPHAAVAGRILSRLVVSADVRLVSLCDGKALASLGQQGDNWLVSCPSAEYGATRRWGHAIRRWVKGAAGLVWPSRRDPSKRAYILFEDRFAAELEEDPGGTPQAPGGVRLDGGVGQMYLTSILKMYLVTLVP